jgi:hypothetical protein
MKPERLSLRIWLLLWIAISAVLIVTGWDNIITRSGWDPDDQLRMVQLRDFLNGQSWFDITQYRMNAPEGAPMHWSRFIELPLAIIIVLLSPFIGQAGAEMAAGTIVPLIGLGLTALLLGQIATRIAGRNAGIVAVILTFLSPAILMQFRPMRIDHHGWQILMACLALATIFWPNRQRAGIVLGLALAVWLHISLEGAPMTAAFFVLLGWRWIFEKAQGRRLFWTIISFVFVSLLLFFGTQRSGIFAATYCDTVSPPHIFAICIAALIMLPAIAKAPKNWRIRLAVAAVAGIAAGTTLLSLAPQCAGGAFATLDPLVREYWYARISEGLPVWHQGFGSYTALLAAPVCGIFALFMLWRSALREDKVNLRIAGFFLLYAFLLALLVFRTVSVTSAFAIPLIAALIIMLFKQYRESKNAIHRVSIVALMLALFVPGALVGKITSANKPKEPEVTVESKTVGSKADCESAASVSALAAIEKTRFVAPFDMGPMILLTTPHSVLASSHHRNEMAMHDHIEIFRSAPDVSRAIIVKRGITHIAACTHEAEMMGYAKTDPKGLWAMLAKKQTPDWLEPLSDAGDGIKVWKVKK